MANELEVHIIPDGLIAGLTIALYRNGKCSSTWSYGIAKTHEFAIARAKQMQSDYSYFSPTTGGHMPAIVDHWPTQ